jgi:hypothetical protein
MQIQFQYLPEKIAARGLWQRDFSSRLAILIGEQDSTGNKASVRRLFQQRALMVKRSGQAKVIVVEEADEVSGAYQQTNISGASHSLVPIETHVFYAGQIRTDVCRVVGRGIVHNDHFDVSPCRQGTLHSPHQQVWPMVSRDDQTDSWHLNFKSQISTFFTLQSRIGVITP